MNRLCTLLLCALTAFAAAYAQSETIFAYASKDSNYEPAGTSKFETYDVAIALTQSDLAGKSIDFIEIPVYPSPNISNLSIWVAKELKLELVEGKNTNIVDKRWLMDMPAQGDIQFLHLDLDEKYVIPDGGVYVGYSLTVDKVDNTEATHLPIIGAMGGKEGGFYLHTSRSYLNWRDRSIEFDYVSLIQVGIAGDIMDNAIALGQLSQNYAEIGKECSVTISVYNTGMNPVSSLRYTSTVGDNTHTEVLQLDKPLEAMFAYSRDLQFVLPAIDALGLHQATVRVEAVNDTELDQPVATTGIVQVLNFIPKHLALVEEFTGTWCGWCPRGFVAMEKMNELFPDFVGIAYHDSDPMSMLDGYPLINAGFPSAAIDRARICDPYNAEPTESGFSMPIAWQRACAEFSPVGIEIDAIWHGDSTVTVNSEVEWVIEPDPSDAQCYRVEYVLLANDLHSPSIAWRQKNYYSGSSPEEYMDFFCHAPNQVSDLHFNDVAILTSGLTGVEGSIQSTEVGYTNCSQYTFDLRKALNGGEKPIPFDKDKLHVVAFVLRSNDAYGTVENATKCPVTISDAGIGAISTDRGHAIYYDLQGIKVAHPSPGNAYIRVRNGKAEKIIY